MYSSEEQNNKDGFESDSELDQQELEPAHNLAEDPRFRNDDVYYALPPGQGIAAKRYSLHPDIATGWKPRKNRSHPIPISVSFPFLDSLFDKILKSGSQKMRLCYYGPRYDNTYFAWYKMPFDFPYSHIEPPDSMKFTNRPFCGQHPDLQQVVVFDSFYESGNLDCVIQVDQFEYDLYLRVDANTRGHFLWYNFKVTNLQKNRKYKFNICNMQKDTSLYSRGMKPYVLSQVAKEKLGREWIQQGQNIKYERRASKSLSVMDPKCKFFYQLSFEYSTAFEQDTVQMAYSIPFTYTDLKNYLETARKKNQKNRFYFEEKLCMSLGGLPIPLITINDDTDEASDRKKCIVVAARVHPGESNSSFLMTGLLDFLTSNKKHAKHVRAKTIIKIIPMLNPDGVCFGNYRTGLSGKDFNREYLNPDPQVFPEVHSLKKLVDEYKKKFGTNFLMFLDLHGHTVKKNVFMYGPEYNIMDRFYYESRIFPRVLSKRTPMFRYYSCVFKIEDAKKTTARAIFARNLSIGLCYTIQASNGSYYDTQLLKDVPFRKDMWTQMGAEAGAGISEYLSIMQAAEQARINKMKILQQRKLRSPQKIKQETNFRTSRLAERKKEKKKARGQIQARQYQTNNGNEDDVDDLLKYIYEEIEQAELHKRKLQQEVSRDAHLYAGVEPEDLNQSGDSDQESQNADLDDAQLKILYTNIKGKKLLSEDELKEMGYTKSNQESETSSTMLQAKFTNRRVFSALGSRQEEYCKKLAQPKKTPKITLGLDLPNKSQEDPKYKFPFATERKQHPKTFQEFVTSCKNWEKLNRSVMENTPSISKTISKDVAITGNVSPVSRRQSKDHGRRSFANTSQNTIERSQEKKNMANSTIERSSQGHRKFQHRSTSAKCSPYFSRRC